MPIEQKDGCIVITGENSQRCARLLTMKAALKLEMKGLSISRGRSVYVRVKEEFGLKGSRAKVLAALEAIIEREYPTPESAQ